MQNPITIRQGSPGDTIKCPQCDTIFIRRKHNQRFCSRLCQTSLHHYARTKNAAMSKRLATYNERMKGRIYG